MKRCTKGQNTDGMNGGNQFSIVAVDRFIQATRDSGYKNTSRALTPLHVKTLGPAQYRDDNSSIPLPEASFSA